MAGEMTPELKEYLEVEVFKLKHSPDKKCFFIVRCDLATRKEIRNLADFPLYIYSNLWNGNKFYFISKFYEKKSKES
jgi:hypothetical protein